MGLVDERVEYPSPIQTKLSSVAVKWEGSRREGHSTPESLERPRQCLSLWRAKCVCAHRVFECRYFMSKCVQLCLFLRKHPVVLRVNAM